MSASKMNRETEGLARRDFLRTASIGAVAGVGATLLGGGVEAEAAETMNASKSGYRETDHVRRVYDLSRF